MNPTITIFQSARIQEPPISFCVRRLMIRFMLTNTLLVILQKCIASHLLPLSTLSTGEAACGLLTFDSFIGPTRSNSP